MENKNHILKRMLACAVVVFVAVTATIVSGVVGIELPKWSEMFVTRASAASEGHYTYSVSNGKATITDVNDSISGNVTIPSKLGGYPVIGIGDSVFKECTGLTSVTIPDSVTSIGEDAFYGCTGLKSVTIGNSVTNIGDSAFAACIGLTKINWNAEKIQSLCYLGYCGCCYYGVFREAGTAGTGLKVVFGDNVKSIPDYAFYECTGLQSVTFGKSITSIGDEAFGKCTRLTNVNIPDLSAWIKIVFGNRYSNPLYYGGKLNINGKLVTNITIPDSVTSIGDYAFIGCTSLKSLTIGKSVKSIGYSAFCGCTKLTKINWNAENVKDLMYTEDSDPNWYSKKVFLGAGASGDGLHVVFGNSVKTIPACAFSGSRLTRITIGNSVTNIGLAAFEDCIDLKSVTIGKNVKSIGYYAFGGCSNLERINWTAVNVSECERVFEDSGTDGAGIKVVFGDNVKTIPASTFWNCTGLASVTIPNSVTSIGNSAFSCCTGLKNITIPNSVTSIGEEAFYHCIGLTSVTIPDSVTSIGDSAFENCTGLKSITIPDSVTKIGSKAFSGCNTQIRFTGKPPAFSSDTFGGLKGTVLYPYKISEWKSVIKSKYGGQFTWVCYSKGKLTELKIKSMPKKTVYYQGQTANYSGLSLSAKWSDGFSAVITPDSKIYDVTISGFSSKTPGLKTVTATVGGKSVKFRLGVHKLNTFTENKSKYPESAHNYADNLKETKTYKCTNALKLVVTFSNKTYVEKDGDYIYVNGTRYTGNQLAGKTITIKGDTLTVKLVSDDYGRGYGYSIDKIVITRVEHVNKTKITPATTSKDGTVVTACEACGKVFKKAVIYKASSVKLSGTAYTYNGKVQKPTVTVKNSKGVTLKNGTDYIVAYSSGCKNPGKYAVKVTFKGNYSGEKTLTFTIAPATPTLTVTAGAKKATLKWNAQTGATGYVVYAATSKTGKYTKIATVKGGTSVSYTKTGLTTGKTYYFKVAAYTTSGGSTIYGSYSSVKGVKVK